MSAPKSNTFEAVLIFMREASEATLDRPVSSLQKFLQLSPASQRKVLFGLTSKNEVRKQETLKHVDNGRFPKADFKSVKGNFRSEPASGDFSEARTAFEVLFKLRDRVSKKPGACATALYQLLKAFDELPFEEKDDIWEKLQNPKSEHKGFIDLLIATDLIYKSEIIFPA
ncbi:MAG: hypothetical protein VX730_06800 [Pseudomonadota bacterium]|nr:hypothetical protein [Pseudomonadota bacterium]